MEIFPQNPSFSVSGLKCAYFSLEAAYFGSVCKLGLLCSKLPTDLLEELALLLSLCFECEGYLRNVDGEVV